MNVKLVLLFFICFCFSCKEKNILIYDLRLNISTVCIASSKQDDFSAVSYDGIKERNTNYDCISNKLNYVKVLISTYKALSKKDENVIQDKLSQGLSLINADQDIIKLFRAKMPPFKIKNGSSPIQKSDVPLFNARTIILDEFKNNDIIMFNEAHDRTQARAFLLSLLKDLKDAGAKYLAMETLNENGNLMSLDITTGNYTPETTMGQIVRDALKLGFKLIPYEDINILSQEVKNEDPLNSREKEQAKNLFNRIKKKGGIEKTVVLAGYSHIIEHAAKTLVGNDTVIFNSMAVHFKEISGINPVTVDQTNILEENIDQPFIKRFLDHITGNDSIKLIKPGLISEKIAKFDSGFDFYIYHPNTKFIHNRPNWLLTSKEKQFVDIKLPNGINPVLVQAYVSEEIKTESDYNIRIPFDQTFLTENGKVWFVLKKNNKYNIVFRGEGNEILLIKEVVVH